MPGTARRLARRYVPLRVRRVVAAVRQAGRAEGSSHLSARRPIAKPARPVAARGELDPLVESLRTGQSLTDAAVQQIRTMLNSGQATAAASIAASLRKEPGSAGAGSLASAIVAYHHGYLANAWALFETVPPAQRWKYAAPEYVRSGIHADRAKVLADVRSLLADPDQDVDAKGWSDILGAVFGAGEEELSREVYAVLDRVVGDGSGIATRMVENRDWMRHWVAASAVSPAAPAVPDGHVSLGIIDYSHPGRSRASANIGDHIQSLASLGHIVRHQDLAFHGSQDLVDLLQQLHGRVRPEMQRTGIKTDVDVITVQRDASMYEEIPPDTWMLAFGWFMHPIFKLRYGFPFHRNLLPIFVSFHCNQRGLLTPEAVEYLRRYGPIGCRDWTTVDVLLSLDVPAFFSGCMTTTVNTVFPDIPEGPLPGAGVGYVDVPAKAVPKGAVTYKHSSDTVRFTSFTANVYDAIKLLETYRREHTGLVTSRLHCWLPSRSIGIPVDFQPKNRSDIRFAGLIDITDAEFHRIQADINAKLEQVLAAVFTGTSPEAVYQLWRELTEPDVAAARQRRAATGPTQVMSVGIGDDVARAVASTVDRHASVSDAPGAVTGEVQIAVHVPAGGQLALGVLLESITKHTSRAAHLWLLTRDPDAIDVDELTRLFPAVSFSRISTRGVGAGLTRGDGRAIAPVDLDLLLLAELLPDVDRVVVLPFDAVVCDDVAELAGLELGDTVLAAPTVVGTRGASGFGVIHAAGLRQGNRTAAATELRRRAYARHAFDFDAFTTDLMILDLSKLRTEKFVAEFLPYVEEYGLSMREVLHFAAGPHRTAIPERWYWVPTRSPSAQPSLIHWADPVKPWADGYTVEQEVWLTLADDVERRQRSA
jgi:hypothetical protein